MFPRGLYIRLPGNRGRRPPQGPASQNALISQLSVNVLTSSLAHSFGLVQSDFFICKHGHWEKILIELIYRKANVINNMSFLIKL